MSCPYPPLSDDEKRATERLLGPEVIRQLLEIAGHYQEKGMTTHLDLRLHFWQGPCQAAELIPVPAITKFRIR